MSRYPAPAPWVFEVRPGDRLRLDPGWTETSGPSNKLPEVVEVVEVIRGRACQSGVEFVLPHRDANGQEATLDAAWFLGPE